MQRIESEQMPATGGRVAANIDRVGWGLFFIWVGVSFLAGLGWGVFFLGTGVLMVAGQSARWRYALKIDRFALLLGACFGVAGLARTFDLHWDWAVVPPWTTPMLFIALGATILVSVWKREHGLREP